MARVSDLNASTRLCPYFVMPALALTSQNMDKVWSETIDSNLEGMLRAIRCRQVIDKAWQNQGREVDAKHRYQQRQFTSSSSSLLRQLHGAGECKSNQRWDATQSAWRG